MFSGKLFSKEEDEICGIAIDKIDNDINIYTFHNNNNNIYYQIYDISSDLKFVKNMILKTKLKNENEELLTSEYACIPKSLIVNIKIDEINNKYRLLVSMENNDEFLIAFSDNKEEIETLKEDIQKQISSKNIMNEFDEIDKILRDTITQIDDLNLSENDPLTFIQSKSSNDISLLPQSIIENNNKRKLRIIEYEITFLDQVNESKIHDLDNFKNTVNQIINTNIEVNDKHGTTLLDVCSTIHDKLGDRKGKRLNGQEKLYVLNELKKKYPNKLFKKDIIYSLYDINTETHSSATTLFGGLLLKDRPRMLPKNYKL